MSRRSKKKREQIHINRANYTAYPSGTPGGGMMYVPPGYAQSTYGQQFYGSSAKNIATGTNALFSPGLPLPQQPNVNPGGFPVQWRFPVAVNTFPVDRTLGDIDIPSFQQLRNLANLYSGIAICERAWFDMVPRMKLNINVKPEYIAAGANENEYKTEIAYFKSWFDKPDKEHDLHSWLRMALKDQTQIDELYIYKRKTRGGGLYALELVAGDQMKPLLDDWGKAPKPPSYAYQQYPWGLPGAWFRSDELFHYQESPSSNTPYGHSRVERIIVLVNQALRKQKKDLSHFTEGNIPQGMMLVPDTAIWTPDQIDAFEQAWNALLSGSQQQQVRMRFTQPGMKYQPFEQYVLDPAFDQFILNETVAAYGLSMQDLGFTGDIHKSSGDSQQNVTYRRTIDPLAIVYAEFFTRVINRDFDPSLNGEMFVATFSGYDEKEDVSAMATAYTTLTGAGILGITNASKLLNLPDDPNSPYIGRVLTTKEGPVFLDDIADEKIRQAAIQAKMATYEQTTNQQQQEKEQQQQAQLHQAMQMLPQSGSSSQQKSTNSSKETSDNGTSEAAAQTALLKQQQKIQKEIEDQQQEQELEEEIIQAMNEDPDAPFTSLERHYWGMHDQKSHGNWSQGRQETEVDTDKETSKDKDDPNALAASITAAGNNVVAAENKLANAKTAADIASAKADVAAAKAAYKQAKSNAAAEIKAENAEAKAELAAQKAQLKEEKLQAHIEKLAAAAANKAAKAQQAAERKAIAAANKAAKSLAKSEKAAERQQLKIMKQEEKAAKTLSEVVKTIGAKAKTYGLLSARKISKTWTIKDASASTAIAQDLQMLLSAVTFHEGSAADILNHLYSSIGELQSSTGLYASQTKMLDMLSSKIELGINRNTEYEELLERIEELFQQQFIPQPIKNDTSDYRRWRNRAIEDVKNQRTIRGFTTTTIPERIHMFISKELEICNTVDDVKNVFERARFLEKEKSIIFVDIDGVFNIPDQEVQPRVIQGKAVLPIPNYKEILAFLEKQFTPIWLTHWGDRANGWNNLADIQHWPVWYPLSEKEERMAKSLYPQLSHKELAIQLYLQYHPEQTQLLWLQDGFDENERNWANERQVILIDTNSEPFHSWLISKDNVQSVEEYLLSKEKYEYSYSK